MKKHAHAQHVLLQTGQHRLDGRGYGRRARKGKPIVRKAVFVTAAMIAAREATPTQD